MAYVAADVPGNEKAIKAHDDAFEVTENNFLVRATDVYRRWVDWMSAHL